MAWGTWWQDGIQDFIVLQLQTDRQAGRSLQKNLTEVSSVFQYEDHLPRYTQENRSCQDANFVFTGGTIFCYYDILQCHQWWKKVASWQLSHSSDRDPQYITWSWERLIFLGIPMQGRWQLHIEMVPGSISIIVSGHKRGSTDWRFLCANFHVSMWLGPYSYGLSDWLILRSFSAWVDSHKLLRTTTITKARQNHTHILWDTLWDDYPVQILTLDPDMITHRENQHIYRLQPVVCHSK